MQLSVLDSFAGGHMLNPNPVIFFIMVCNCKYVTEYYYELLGTRTIIIYYYVFGKNLLLICTFYVKFVGHGVKVCQKCLLPSTSVIALMIEAGSTSETSVNIYQTTRRNIPEDSRLHIRRRENLKAHLF
jgi:hypothetical protein